MWIREAVANEFPQQVEINLTIMSKCNNEADIVDFLCHHETLNYGLSET